MPTDTIVWIILIAAAAVVIGLAVWIGRGIMIRKDDKGFTIKVKEKKQEGVSVAKETVIDKAKIGDIAGIKTTESNVGGTINVAEKAKIKDSQIGDIVGIKQQGNTSGNKL